MKHKSWSATMDQIIDYFPQGLALGDNFCNRTVEKERLKNNILSSRPTLVMSPRRYGKTSLALEVLHNIRIPYARLDLYSELNELEIQNSMLGAIGDILYSIESIPKKALKTVTDFFSDISVSFKLVGAEIKIEFSRSRKAPAKTILEALLKLDKMLKSKKKKVCLFLDEFQRITQITESATIDGAIRQVAQESKNIAFVFSGSNRHLLGLMFDDRKKPLYKLCDRIILKRIMKDEYIPFIEQKAKKKWKKAISKNLIESILQLTEKHPYYVNVLCHRLWLLKKPPTEKDINAIWYQYTLEEKTNVLNEIELLGGNQAKMLIALAKYGDEVLPMSKEFIALTKFSLSSASLAIKSLEKKDYLFTDDGNKYQIIDPLIKYIFLL